MSHSTAVAAPYSEDEVEFHKLLALLRTMERVAGISAVEWDLVHDVVVWPDEVYRILGRDPKEWAPTVSNFIACIHPGDRKQVQEAIEAAVTDHAPLRAQFRIARQDGAERIVQAWMEPTLDRAGNVVTLIGTIHDITTAARAEAKRHEDETRFRSLVEQNIAGVAIIQEDATIAYANPYLCGLMGFTLAEVIGRPALDFISEAEKPAVGRNLQRLKAGKTEFVQLETELCARHGGIVDILVNASSSVHDGQKVAIAVVIDITERNRSKKILRASEERFRDMIENAPDAILLYDVDQHRFIGANAQAEQLFGCSREEIVNRGPEHFCSASQSDGSPVPGFLAETDFLASSGDRLAFERRIRKPTGEERLCQVTMVKLPSAVGNILRGSFVDITEREEAESSLARLNRALRTLSRGNVAVVHATTEEGLLQEMCGVVVKSGGYRMAWIGTVEHDAEKTVKPVAHAGEGAASFVQRLDISWAETSLGLGPAGRSVRTGEAQVSHDISADTSMAPWARLTKEHGIGSSAAFPLKDGSGVFAVMLIYAGEPNVFDADELKLLRELADDLSYGVIALRQRGTHAALEQRWSASLETTVGAIARTLEMRDPYTAGHQQRTSRLAVAIARVLEMPEERIQGLFLAGIIHDVGKGNVPAEILNKPGKLSKLEFALIQEHAEAGYNIVRGIDFPWPVAEMVRQHHERLDGSGYPRGLRGDEILAEAKILAVADVVESMMSHRPYRAALGVEAALTEIENNKGRLFDPAAVEACITLFRDKGFSFDPVIRSSPGSDPQTPDQGCWCGRPGGIGCQCGYVIAGQRNCPHDRD
jgi:PAS domain S-box-containing protein/putative nucleotidyltransferase with HDIG domain